LISLTNENAPKMRAVTKSGGANPKFDNNQPTMVRKCQMAMKDHKSSATQSRATDKSSILPTSKKKRRQQPPPASRHQSVSTLRLGKEDTEPKETRSFQSSTTQTPISMQQ
jgi:hypothetical protein